MIKLIKTFFVTTCLVTETNSQKNVYFLAKIPKLNIY